MTETLIFLAQATEAAEPAQGSGGPLDALFKSGMIFPLALILMMYFILIRPQQKQRKELQARIANMKKGDKVITNGGIHGTVNHKGDSTISLEVSKGVYITMESNNVSTVIPRGSAKTEPETVDVIEEEK